MLTAEEAAAFLLEHDRYLILTHRRPDGDTLGCAAALCRMLRAMGKTAAALRNPEISNNYEPYLEGLWAEEDYRADTIVSVDIASKSLFPDNAKLLRNKVDFAFDHHPSYDGFAKESCVRTECAACGEILYEVAVALGQLTPEVALPLYVAVATDTGCFVYSNVTANTHRVAAALMETGIDVRPVNKRHFRTKSKVRLALEAALLRDMKLYDEDRVVVIEMPYSMMEELQPGDGDLEDIASLGGQLEGTDCSITMRETKGGSWKVSVRTGDRIDANKVCEQFGGGDHRAAAGCFIRRKTQDEVRQALLDAVAQTVRESANA